MAEGGLVASNVQNDTSSEEEDEVYEDAEDGGQVSSVAALSSDMDLHAALVDTVYAMDLFLNNQFTEAKNHFQKWADKSMYHALGYATMMYLQALMTFQSADIEAAVEVVKTSLSVCSRFRRRSGIVSALYSGRRKKAYYDDLTVAEVHAEICYAECLLERAMLMFVQDENLISFIKGSLKVKECYGCYKEGLHILKYRKWKDSDEKVHFESGIRMGNGMFNLMISQLPTRIMKLLEFVGFSGNKQHGLRELQIGASLSTGLRSPLCSLSLIGYHTMVAFLFGTGDENLEYAESLLTQGLKRYPKAALYLFFSGRLCEVTGKIDQAIEKFEESIESQQEWRQFHHICYWELMWCHCYIGDWLLAMKYAERLFNESRWSPAIYAYQKASFLLMCDEQTDEMKSHATYLMQQVPKHKQRIAGKSIPMEKFAVKKSERFLVQQSRLFLPAYELMYMWNGFSVISCRPDLLDLIVQKIDTTLAEMTCSSEHRLPLFYDEYCLALLIKGVCLRHKRLFDKAETCFEEVISHAKDVVDDKYVLPNATYEIGMVYLIRGDFEKAKEVLKQAKNNYKGYSMESRLHFRIHAAHNRIQQLTRLSHESLKSSDESNNSPVCSNGS